MQLQNLCSLQKEVAHHHLLLHLGAIADGGVLLPFGGYKGSAIAMMVELMAGALVGDNFSFETAAKDNNDGGPPSGGEFILAISPEI